MMLLTKFVVTLLQTGVSSEGTIELIGIIFYGILNFLGDYVLTQIPRIIIFLSCRLFNVSLEDLYCSISVILLKCYEPILEYILTMELLH